MAEGFDVLLALLPSREDARAMVSDARAQNRWGSFVTQVLQQHGQQVGAIEVGNTPNRGRWSGYSSRSYLTAWQIAARAGTSTGVALAGPNVSDFEPLYNVGLLNAMGKLHSVPNIHTNNLFVERVVEPEAYDHRVAGRTAARWLQLNLVKKARILANISGRNQVPRTYCTYTCWSRKRLSRWSAAPERKNADYLMRYLVIAAAAGLLDRIYWGPLICQRDGIIDCGDSTYPDVDNVSHYREVRGSVDEFVPTAAYKALRYCIELLSGATCLAAYTSVAGLHHFVFSSAQQGQWHVVWCSDRRSFSLADLYAPSLLEDSRCYSPEGVAVSSDGMAVTEQPLILRWDTPVAAPDAAFLRRLEQLALAGVVRAPVLVKPTHEFQGIKWRGICLMEEFEGSGHPTVADVPTVLPQLAVTKTLRDKRNKLWNVAAPWWGAGEQTVKLNRARGIKRLSYRFLPSKAKRHWNNATEMLRQGVNTPQPLAFFEQISSNAADSYYVCEFIPNAFSCRDVFTAFKEGQNQYQGIGKSRWLQQIAEFVAFIHERSIIHRDLSSGNLMMTLVDGEVVFYLIDIGRAVIGRRRGTRARMRFKDLNRICYKLSWPDREIFIQAYDACSSHSLPRWWRLSLASYDWKQRSKKQLKGTKAKAKSAAKASALERVN